MKSEIIAVGSELLLGQIANTNAQFLSQQLAEMGLGVYYHTVVGDNPDRLKQAVNTAKSRSNIIIFTGGLGPTKDDLTKETISSLLGRKLVTDENALSHIEEYFKKTKRTMSENNKKQALVIEDSFILKNEFGMAPGMAIEVNDIHFMFLPGPPSEMKPMFLNFGRDYFMSKLGQQEKITSRVLRYFGIGESQLETDIQDLIDSQTNPTIAPLAGDGEVTIRLTARHKEETTAFQLLDELENKINERVGSFFYGYDNTTLIQELMNVLHEKDKSISAAESLTGGLFTEQLTAVKGTSKVLNGGIVCYTNETKRDLLKVSEKTLETVGAVSRQCALEMAENIQSLTNSDIGISFTGEAGPVTNEDQPIGRVYIGIAASGQETIVHRLHVAGGRNTIRKRTVKYGCQLLIKQLNENTVK
ncbi:competence/damage-inducible protein A [Bacillus sp. IB182487]|uniref:Putative competence-damage inducible protein n=1 Tax=Metabacillus arenae TaxID=2771434 RepID=A0A926NF14_9BACI|nr:competence/damage-inducible protein A [Metabacillus arenae]